jgi:hypothetical protein
MSLWYLKLEIHENNIYKFSPHLTGTHFFSSTGPNRLMLFGEEQSPFIVRTVRNTQTQWTHLIGYVDCSLQRLPQDVPLSVRQGLHSQYDSGTAQCGVDFRKQLTMKCPGRQRADSWSPRSPDLTAMRSLLCGRPKEVHVIPLRSVEDPVATTGAAATRDAAKTLRRVGKNASRRTAVCHEMDADRFKTFCNQGAPVHLSFDGLPLLWWKLITTGHIRTPLQYNYIQSISKWVSQWRSKCYCVLNDELLVRL